MKQLDTKLEKKKGLEITINNIKNALQKYKTDLVIITEKRIEAENDLKDICREFNITNKVGIELQNVEIEQK